jgi:uncharacterized protein
MLGVIVNVCTVLAGSIVGLLFKKGISEKFTSAIMCAIGLCTLAIGVKGIFNDNNTLAMILSLVLGTAVGTWIDLDGWITNLGERLEKRFAKQDGTVSVTQGFVTASLLFCIGSMTIVGCLNAGLKGDNQMLFTKSLLDLISAAILSVSLGIGVLFSAAFVLVFQGALVLLAGVLQPVLTTPMINAITCVGSLSILALGLNLLKITNIKVANQLPALVLAPFICWCLTAVGLG